MLHEWLEKVNDWATSRKEDIFLASTIFFVGLLCFGLGRLSAVWPEKKPLRVIRPEVPAAESQTASAVHAGQRSATLGTITASKNGTAYYFAWCSNSIKEENKITFASETEAQVAGYRLAKNCSK